MPPMYPSSLPPRAVIPQTRMREKRKNIYWTLRNIYIPSIQEETNIRSGKKMSFSFVKSLVYASNFSNESWKKVKKQQKM